MLTIDYRLLDIRRDDYVLDVGCGEGRHSYGAWRYGPCNVIAVDLDEAAIAKTGVGMKEQCVNGASAPIAAALRGDALNLPFPDAFFDKVICSEMLEHIPDDRFAIREIVRVLKRDGRLAVSVPRYLSERICWALSKAYRTTEGGHVRIYRTSELASLLTGEGLHLEAVRFKHALHSPYWVMRCIFGLENEGALIPSLYHRFLVWDLMKNPAPVRLVESLLDPFISKSVVLYLRKACIT